MNITPWQHKLNYQPITYPCTEAVNAIVKQLYDLPPLVTPDEINQLTTLLTAAQHGKVFLFQGGDCAELFTDCTEARISRQVKLLQDIRHLLQRQFNKPIVLVGRIAGQYAKPRSQTIETRAHTFLPSYRGDLINSPEFTPNARTPNPQRLLQGYNNAAWMLNHIRAITTQTHPLFTSHEALHLFYEQALTRYDQTSKQWYNVSTHFPWLGMRTAKLDSAHLEYLRGIANPIAIKVGPALTHTDLIAMIKLLNPLNKPGRITLISRFGKKQVNKQLGKLIDAITQHKLNVLWSCDPMHGNTYVTAQKLKMRSVNDILAELTETIKIHRLHGTLLSGMHLELTADNITECSDDNTIVDPMNYKSLVDPRLNRTQILTLMQALPAMS